jgi:hypothetical protein
MIDCACGCGQKLPARDRKGRPRKFIHGHNRRGLNNHWSERDSDHWRTNRERARKSIDVSACSLVEIGGCKGTIEAHHIDGDFTNNDLTNLTPLCRAHHQLVEHERIDLSDPVMPRYRVDANGKRRYSYG